MILPAPRARLDVTAGERALGLATGLGMLAVATALLRCGALERPDVVHEAVPPVTIAVGRVEDRTGPRLGDPSFAPAATETRSHHSAARSEQSAHDSAPRRRRSKPLASALPGLRDLSPAEPVTDCGNERCSQTPVPGSAEAGIGPAEPGGGGGDDDRGAAAIAAYREALARWLAPHFEVRGTGLTGKRLATVRVAATLEVEPDGTLTRYEITPSGDPRFDEAADRALRSVLGRVLPDPPPEYPGPLQSRIRVTFRCRPQACD